MERLTDLEGAALGFLHRNGGCSAYAIRRHFRSSPSALFSGSAGAVYPMVKRLASRGLLRKRATRQGRRAATLYALSPTGITALRRWLEVPATLEELVTWDPLRTRALGLGLLTPAARVRWVERAEQALEEHAEHIRRLDAATPKERTWERLAHRNVLLQAAARRKWIGEVRAALDG